MPNNKEHLKQAVAISYDPLDVAPRVIAKGQGYVAETIIKKAEEAEVSIVKDAALVRELSDIELGLHIPPELYHAVAEILIFVENVNKKVSAYTNR